MRSFASILATGAAVLAAVTAATGAQAQGTVKIGLIMPFSGQFADAATQMDNAIKLWVKQNGDTVAGKKLEFIRKDTGGIAPDVAKRLAQELVVRDNVDILAGFVLTPNAMAAGDVSQQAKKFMVVMNAATSIITTKSEVCPINHAAVSLAESWWEADEAVRQLPPETVAELDRLLDKAWTSPVTACWIDLNLDLGGGKMVIHALPKLNGEVILMFPLPGADESAEEALSILTRRQREIMDWIAEGKTSGEAAIILGISPRTVEKHLEAVFQRLGVENRIAAMRRYLDMKRGL